YIACCIIIPLLLVRIPGVVTNTGCRSILKKE
ncbi:hypothetical protein Trydic_g22052, partial [Trypoxylus dichotomus]